MDGAFRFCAGTRVAPRFQLRVAFFAIFEQSKSKTNEIYISIVSLGLVVGVDSNHHSFCEF